VAASQVYTVVVNYGIALGVGLFGTAEVNIHKDGGLPDIIFDAYRAALYTGAGISGLGVLVAVVFLTRDLFRRRERKVVLRTPMMDMNQVEVMSQSNQSLPYCYVTKSEHYFTTVWVSSADAGPQMMRPYPLPQLQGRLLRGCTRPSQILRFL
jgi:hypothetical protein